MILAAVIIATICVFGALSVENDFYSFTVKDAEGNDFSLDQFRGKVTLVVNVASLCGFTEEHYEALTKLDNIHSHDGYFRVLAFPCNQFGEQEPGTNEEILRFAMGNFKTEFPIFGKIDVYGEKADKAFKNLYQQNGVVPDWNFYKYLVSHEGKVLNAWGPKTSVEKLLPAIQAAIRGAKDADKDGSVAKKEVNLVYKVDTNDPGLMDYDFDYDASQDNEHEGEFEHDHAKDEL